ncbi:endonuclease Q family protein [Pontibacillus yanchengensis]|uniref:TIGR00375 family protein n=1 Tax=Pontibacillus yanchengensis Y32 TaxID=1385514 RepID=A0A0A2TDI6_9BACI|nr:endonuclease Q family protein [Pontibacillus yanchengensis]KGP72166.1 hypothetical protein N782_13650 [Pontibacillus yanchengensis Y32]
MNTFYIDLHVHIGRTIYGDPVKITASDQLTLTNIIHECSERKGIDMVGVIDSHVPDVQAEIQQLLDHGEAIELGEGGIQYKSTTLILGSEIEIYDTNCHGPLHVLCYFPTLERMQQFTVWLSNHMKNITLSTQRFYGEAIDLQKKVQELEGLFVPAHMFTPFKSLYGKGVQYRLAEVLNPALIDAVELGLSADTKMADCLSELHEFTFLTNSDAHSIPKIAREYQQICIEKATFKELKRALRNQGDRRVVANYGLNPRLGKYFQTTCANCFHPVYRGESCKECGSKQYIKGVSERIHELQDTNTFPTNRPPYISQVPLEFLPYLGPKTLRKLLNEFGTEMNVIHNVTREDLLEIVPPSLADRILANRNGELSIKAGGGGRYGSLSKET